jgi:hypothetical protein
MQALSPFQVQLATQCVGRRLTWGSVLFLCYLLQSYQHAVALQGRAAGMGQVQADLGSLAARVAVLEVQQQQLSLAAQSGEASAALLEMQPTVKNRCGMGQGVQGFSRAGIRHTALYAHSLA